MVRCEVLLNLCLLFASQLRCNAAFRPADKADLQLALSFLETDPREAFLKYGDVLTWDTSMVTDMSELFAFADKFNASIVSWDTSKVTTMRGMFHKAHAFNQNISSWNTARVKDMSAMFSSAFSFNQEIGSWNTAKVTNMSRMFARTFDFDQKIGNWSTGSVTDMSYMFARAWSFNQEIAAWDTSHVVDMSHMFERTEHFNRNISCWSVCSLRDMTDMFCNAVSYFFVEVQAQLSCPILRPLSWPPPLRPPDCGACIRNLTPLDVSSCLMASTSTSRAADDALELLETSSPQEPKFALTRLALIACGICGCIVAFLHGLWSAKPRYVGVPILTREEILQPLAQNSHDPADVLCQSFPGDATSSIATHSLVLDNLDSRNVLGRNHMPRSLVVHIDNDNFLGQGRFGRTYISHLHSTGGVEKVVAKFLRQSDLFESDALGLHRSMTEAVELPGGALHRNLVQVLAYERSRRAIIMEFCDGNLEWFRKATPLCMAEQVALMEQVAAACAWIVRQGCVHGNLKMQNILITTRNSEGNREAIAKVADFGFIAKGIHLTEKSDIFCFGHILLETFCPHIEAHRPETVANRLAVEWKKTDP